VRFTPINRVPLLQGHLFERRILLQAGVVDQDVDRAELSLYSVEHGNDFVFL
jgi:hypothetical protein